MTPSSVPSTICNSAGQERIFFITAIIRTPLLCFPLINEFLPTPRQIKSPCREYWDIWKHGCNQMALLKFPSLGLHREDTVLS